MNQEIPEMKAPPENIIQITPLKRMVGILISPLPAFREIISRPDWLIPLMVVLAIYFVATYLTVPFKLSEASPAEPSKMLAHGATNEDLAQAVVLTEKYGSFVGALGAMLGRLAAISTISIIIFFLGKVVSSTKIRFKTVFSICIYSSLIGAVGNLVKLPFMFHWQTGEIQSSPAAILSSTLNPSFFYQFLKALDIFSIWQFVVIAIGITVLYQISFKKATGIILILFLIELFFSITISSGWT